MILSRYCLVLISCRLLAIPSCTAGAELDDFPGTNRLQHLGNHVFKITTSSAAAQESFNRGLTLAYSFGHFAAEQEFRRALKADPNCAMAWWGIALVNGPHINFPLVPPDKAATAWLALTNAQRLAHSCSPLEQDLVEALTARYANPQPDDRSPLDVGYANAMRKVWQAFPQSSDAAALFAEAAMDLHPWDFWSNNAPQPWTPEILATLEQSMHLDPNNPGANHFYIHVIEGGPNPAKAVPQADRLRDLVPDSSHMVHMPSHIYARVGRWDDAAQANHAALLADKRYQTVYPHPGFYAMYMAHNVHFLAFVSMMQGHSSEAIECARRMIATIPPEFLQDYGFIADGYMAVVPEALMRFGRWEEILKEPDPGDALPLARALWRYTRATALNALGRTNETAVERAAFSRAAAAVPKDRTMGNNPASDLLTIATLTLDAEIAAATNDFKTAIAKLGEAVSVQDDLHYDEPPDWIQPVRHTLGAVLMRAGRYPEAEGVYRADLKAYPENGWSLMGLRDALRRQGKESEADAIDQRFQKAWATADVKPRTTCYCQSGK